MTRVMFGLMSRSPLVQSAEKGSYPEVMCATENGLDLRALWGPTGWNEWVGPVGKGTLEPFAYDKPSHDASSIFVKMELLFSSRIGADSQVFLG